MRLPKAVATILGAAVFGRVTTEKIQDEPTTSMTHSKNENSPKNASKSNEATKASQFCSSTDTLDHNKTGVVTNGKDIVGSCPQLQQSSLSEDGSANLDNDAYSLKQQLRLLVGIRCLRSAHLAQPLLVPYYSQSLGLTPTSVLWLGSFYSALVTVAELPSGVLSDRLGRKATLHIAFLGFALCLSLTALASTTSIAKTSWLLWTCLGLAQFARAIGSSLYSGTDMAFLYEILRKYNIEKGDAMLLSIESRNVFYTTATESCVAAVGGWLASRVSLSTVVGLSTIPFGVGAVLTLFLDSDLASTTNQEPDSKSTGRQESQHCGNRNDTMTSQNSFTQRASFITLPSVSPIFQSLHKGFHVQWELLQKFVPTHLWPLFGVGVVLNCGTYLAATAINPLLWETVGIPVGHFGSLHAGCGATAASSALLAPMIRRYLRWRENSTEALLLFLLGASALGYALIGLSSSIQASSSMRCAILASLLLSLVRGLAWPVLGSAINASVSDNGSRATTLSIFSGSVKIGMVLTGMVIGALFQTPTADAATVAHDHHADIRKGLLQGSILCFVALVSTLVWLAVSGLSVTQLKEGKNDNKKSE